MSDNPWAGLISPSIANVLSGRRVDADLPWDFFWARSSDGKYVLTLGHDADSAPRGSLPHLKGIDISEIPDEPDGRLILMLKLRDSAQLDIFERLCRDIVRSTRGASSEREAVAAALGRTWRWHHLLRGGSDERLSIQEQKGLIGELIVLERYLLQQLPAVEAVSDWLGPLGSPRDFEVARTGIEAKARRGAAEPFVAISSEFQLDNGGLDHLFLFVVELAQSPTDTESAFTVTQRAQTVRERLAETDQGAIETFESRLAATGFRWEDDYSDSVWIEGTSRLYRVADGFPRIDSVVISGVSNVRYSISLIACESFITTAEVLSAALKGESHGN